MEVARELKGLMAKRVGGSVIVIGPPGSGKTTITKQALSEAKIANALWLDGLFSNDFTINLLRLFQHFQLAASNDLNTFEELSDALLRKHCDQKLPFNVIVIEWLDMFVDAGGSSGQQLLYGLLELTAVLPILAIGLTRRIDVVEGMEKRVRSRFSQNLLYLPHRSDDDSPPFQQGSSSVLLHEGLELSGPELLILVCLDRLLAKNCNKINASTLLSEYSHGLRVETDAYLLTFTQASSGQSAVAGERQLLRAIESLIYRGIIKYSRNDFNVERQFRLLSTCVPSFVLPDLITKSSSCPIPIKMVTTRHK